MQLARGHIEYMEHDERGLRVRGWMLVPSVPASIFRIVVGGSSQATCAPRARDDVARDYPRTPHAQSSGFDFVLEDVPQEGVLEIEALSGERVVATLRSRFRADLADIVPTPPPARIERTIGTADAAYYRAEGIRSYSNFREAIEPHRPIETIGRMLDWGCGVGRNAVHFLRDLPETEVHGCDLDRDAIAWCREHLPRGRFQVSPAEPPAPYADAFFDLVIGCSVFTHLDRRRQRAWLEELRRILAPGGLLVASVHGDFAASLHRASVAPRHRPRAWLRWLARGFDDLGEDPRLAGAAPPGYYRSVFQSRRHTMRTWSRVMEVVDYLPAGMQAYQDLVILRRR